MKKDTRIYLTLGVIVILIIIGIFWLKKNGETIDEKTIKCIAQNSLLIVKEGCSRCAAQKQILGNYTSYFEIASCEDKCIEYNVRLLPAWIIKGEKYEEIFSLEELKKLTGC